MNLETHISQGQQQARIRWGTQESGAAFDRKKSAFLTEDARNFIAQQAMCIIVGPGPKQEPCGLMLTGQPGFVETPDRQSCFIPVERRYVESFFFQGMGSALAAGVKPSLALCFLQHATRQRICVQGEAELLPAFSLEERVIRLHVSQAFFHCAKYIRTRVSGLHIPKEASGIRRSGQAHNHLTEEDQAFLARQVLCFLCTKDQEGQYAVNHRGGSAGFLVTLPPDQLTPGGMVLLPDYAGNGAFEAIGNIMETGQAALIVPDYAEQRALCVSGVASVLEPCQLPFFLRERCRGAQRIVVLDVCSVEPQEGDWSAALAYERTRAAIFAEAAQAAQSCPV